MDEIEAGEREIAERLASIRVQKEQRAKEMKSRARYARKKQKLDEESTSNDRDEDEDAEFAPDNYENQQIPDDGISPAVRKLMQEWVHFDNTCSLRLMLVRLQSQRQGSGAKQVSGHSSRG